MAYRNTPRRTAEQLVSIRTQRLEELIREELNFLFDTEVTDPCLEGTHVTRVVLTPDGARANVFFVREHVSPDEDDYRLLARAVGFLRFRIGGSLELKRTPELRFYPEPQLGSVGLGERTTD